MSHKKKAKPKLRVVFDTNVLHTQVASDLVRREVKELIEHNSGHADLKIEWYLPNIVIDERRYQMRQKANELLPPVTKLERLLGHKLNITEDILAIRVDEAIDKQLLSLGISALALDSSNVDWESIIYRAVFRNPPFEVGDKEKGFRDSLIAQTFFQLVEESPSTPSVCRLAIISNDDLLAQYVADYTKDKKNIRVLKGVSDLESLINTLVSEVTEEFISEIKQKVSSFFFEKGNEASLYYKEKIGEKVSEQCGKELKATPTEGVIRENYKWWIVDPVFISKDRQRTCWSTTLLIDSNLYKYEWAEPTSSTIYGGLAGTTAGTEPMASTIFRGLAGTTAGTEPMASTIFGESAGITADTEQTSRQSYGLSRLFGKKTKKIKIGSGHTKIEISWSVNITQTNKLTSPRIEKIEFVSTDWDEES